MLWKTLLALTATLFLIAAVLVTSSVLGYMPTLRIFVGDDALILGLAGKSVIERGVWGVGAFFLFLSSFVLFGFALRSSHPRGFSISNQKFGRFLRTGQVVVSSRGIHALAAYTAERIKGVYEAATKVRLNRRGWWIDVHIVVAPETSLPELLAEIKERMQEVLMNHTGLPVARLRVWAQLDPMSNKKRVC